MVDVLTEIEIDRSVDRVAAYAADPNHAPSWYQNIKFPMETTYAWQALGANRTRMTLRNRGNPSGFSRWVTPFMAIAMRRANRKDLATLKRLLEATP